MCFYFRPQLRKSRKKSNVWSTLIVIKCTRFFFSHWAITLYLARLLQSKCKIKAQKAQKLKYVKVNTWAIRPVKEALICFRLLAWYYNYMNCIQCFEYCLLSLLEPNYRECSWTYLKVIFWGSTGCKIQCITEMAEWKQIKNSTECLNTFLPVSPFYYFGLIDVYKGCNDSFIASMHQL